ncbi:hypothetical protein BJ138DRAFT_1106912 [Hygrophoropsis aurantiaca]|uniref:Uncharacterized protein n=1 Tax=Hygrophoropsis aurantiaca TaxID=72124 RepID=A0ACB7ZTH4_9AGAM|nr:hypothetical protein BJ138DRAFT_1106912 [Hygrophoropsis aurantiaca]
MSTEKAPYRNGMQLGRGFNTYTQETCLNDAVIVTKSTPPVKYNTAADAKSRTSTNRLAMASGLITIRAIVACQHFLGRGKALGYIVFCKHCHGLSVNLLKRMPRKHDLHRIYACRVIVLVEQYNEGIILGLVENRFSFWFKLSYLGVTPFSLEKRSKGELIIDDSLY